MKKIIGITAAVLAAFTLAGCSTSQPTVEPQLSSAQSAALPASASSLAPTTPAPVTVTAAPPVTVTAAPPLAPVTITEAAPPPVIVQAPAPAPQYQYSTTGIYGLPSGLLCRDMRDRGYGYWDAWQYWYAWGQPDRMDIDLNGVPCETVWSPDER
jgi:hypothetical protein